MAHSPGPSRFSQVLGIAAIFVVGGLSHWTYTQFTSAAAKVGSREQALPDPGNAQRGAAAMSSGRPLPVAANEAAWRAEDPSDAHLAGEYTRQRKQAHERRRLALAARTIVAYGREIQLPDEPFLPETVTEPAISVDAAATPGPAAALYLPARLLHAGEMARAARKITQAAGVRSRFAFDPDRFAIAALRSELIKARRELASSAVLRKKLARAHRQIAELDGIRGQLDHTRQRALALEAEYAGKLQRSRERVAILVEQHISRAARVSAPALLAGIRPSIVARTAPARNSAGKKARAVEPLSGRAWANAAGPLEGAAGVAAAKSKAGAGPASTSARLPAPETIDLTGVREAIAAFKKGDVDEGRAHAAKVRHPVAKAAVAWAEVRLQPRRAGYFRIAAFLARYPDWPMRRWLHWRAEQGLYADLPSRRFAAAYLEKYRPVSAAGYLVEARQLLKTGNKKRAGQVLAAAWRGKKFTTWLERQFLKHFAAHLSAADIKYRADRMFYRERYSHSLRLAGRAGKEAYALAAARVSVARGGSPSKFGAKLSSKSRLDPTWKLAQAVRLRRTGKPEAAAQILQSVKAPPADRIAGKAWWMERRMVARRLLDNGNAKLAYQIAAAHGLQARNGGVDSRTLVDAEFYSGWLALRFIGKPALALTHFNRALKQAKRPGSIARAAYWQGRAAERGSSPADAERLYAMAARFSSTYYGQVARARLKGTTLVPLRRAAKAAAGADRILAVRTVELLRRADAGPLANTLSYGLARELRDRAQIAALAVILKRERDARSTMIVGRLAARRGIQFDDVAFPDFGVPQYVALENSADRSMVFAIARQESAFRANAKSHAGAKGLMQMLTSTARVTAKRKGIPFDADRLLSDPAFNAQLGAAHLGDLMREHPGSLTLVFAAYNAGGGRVKQWIRTYGDPRKAGVDPIDWVERIPIAETRHYVQRVTENLGVYRAILGRSGPPHPAASQFRALAARW